MSQLPEQLLKPSNIPIVMPMGQNINLINPVPMTQPLQSQPNFPPNPNITPMGIQVPENKSQPNQDTSN